MTDILVNAVSLRRSRAGGAESVASGVVPRLCRDWTDGTARALVRSEERAWLASIGWPDDHLVTVDSVGSGPLSVVTTGLAARRTVKRHGDAVLSLYNMHTPGARRDREVVVVHDFLRFRYVSGEWGRLPPAALARQRAKAWALAEAVKKAAAVIVHTETVRDEARRFVPEVPPERIHLVSLGADREAVAGPRHPDLDDPFVLVVGSSTSPHKNLDLVLAAARTEAFAGLGLRMVMVGRTVPVLDDESRRRVTVRENIDDDELDRLYRSCTCLIMPSLSEGFGLPLVEAMRNGVPCVVSDIPVFREIGGEHVVTFDPTDVGSLVDALSTVTSAPAEASARAEAGAAAVAWRTWDATAAGYADVLRQVG